MSRDLNLHFDPSLTYDSTSETTAFMSVIERICTFKNVGQCTAFLKEYFSGTIDISAVEVQRDGSHLSKKRTVPRYLFRGEDCDRSVYESTVSAWRRLRRDKNLDDKDRSEIDAITRSIVNWFCLPESRFDLQKHDAFGLVQHLGLPTEYLDFSADPEVAGAFAVGNLQNSNRRAAICVLDVQKAIEHGRLAEFCQHPWCERARRQQAYGYEPPEGIDDLKSPEGIAKAGLWWFEFPGVRAKSERIAR